MPDPLVCTCGYLFPIEGETARCPKCGRLIAPALSTRARTRLKVGLLALVMTLLGGWLLALAVEKVQDASDRST